MSLFWKLLEIPEGPESAVSDGKSVKKLINVVFYTYNGSL